MNIQELISEDLVVFSHQSVKNSLLEEIADVLYANHKVKKTFKEAVITREERFPTGLDTGNFGIAIPHTDGIHVNKPAIAIAILSKKVPFIQMGSFDEIVQVEVIFMLALNKAENQLEALQALIALIQDKETIRYLKNAKDAHQVIQAVDRFFEHSSSLSN